MDREFAIRLVVFEYLLPMQRAIRCRAFLECARAAKVNRSHITTVRGHAYPRHQMRVWNTFEDLLTLSDRLLSLHGFATSYVYPISMQDEDPEMSKTVSALIDSPGFFRWSERCPRIADPNHGFRTFRSGHGMPAGVITI